MAKTHTESSFFTKTLHFKNSSTNVDSFSRTIGSTGVTAKRQKTKHSWEPRQKPVVSNEGEVRKYLEKGEKSKENEIVDKVTTKLEEKLKTIQDGMTLQLKQIIETME